MHVVYSRCCGLDVHKQKIFACVLLSQSDGSVIRHLRSCSTMTAELLALLDWLQELQVEVVAMESTGVFWQPVFNLFESHVSIVLVNAQHMKAVPGRKTDVKDSEWIADLLRHGLLQASFLPPKPIREVRELTRYRKMLLQQRAQEINRLQKVLETANLKLSSVASNVVGKSGRSMLDALLSGEQNPLVLAELARGRLRAKLPELRLALDGRLQAHQAFLLKRILTHIDFLDASITNVEGEIEQRLQPYQEALCLLESLPVTLGVAAAVIIGEIGVDMSRFPSAKHLASWAGVCPGNRISAGKRLSGRTPKGNRYLKAVLCEVAWTIARSKDNYLSAQYHQLARRRGKKRALLAVAHSLLVIIYSMLHDKKPYSDLGADYLVSLQARPVQ